jgi:hypothetical protein
VQLFVDGTERADLRLEEGWWTYAFPLPKFSIGSHDVRLHLAPDVPLPPDATADVGRVAAAAGGAPAEGRKADGAIRRLWGSMRGGREPNPLVPGGCGDLHTPRGERGSTSGVQKPVR